MTSYHYFSSAFFADVQFLFHFLYFDTSDIVEKDTAVKDNVYGKFINHLGTSSVLITISKVAPATTNNTIAIASATRETTSLISFLFSQFFYTFLQIVFKYFNDFRFCNRLTIPVAQRTLHPLS